MAKIAAVILGLVFIGLGLIGYAVPRFLGLYLTPWQNLIYLVSGALALYFGWRGTYGAARAFCLAFGAIYGLLGLAGFFATGPSQMLIIAADELVMGTADHVFHLLVAALFLIAGVIRKPADTRAGGGRFP